MAHKKRNKQKSSQQDMKMLAARYRKDFLRNVKYYFDIWLGENSFNLLPQKQIDILYTMRFTPIRIEPIHSVKINKKLNSDFKETLEILLKLISTEISKDNPEITLSHFTTFYLTIYVYLNSTKEEYFDGAKEILQKFNKLEAIHDRIMEKAFEKIIHIARLIGLFYSTPDERYFWLTENINITPSTKHSNYLLWNVNTTQPIVYHFTINNKKRPAYKFGIPLVKEGVKWKTLKPPENGMFQWKEELEIFIQAHALRRLYERLEPLYSQIIRYYLFHSFLYPEPFYEEEVLLIPFNINGITVGYFKADIIQGKMLLRTFLFLTNEGTPEARKLKENTGLSKTDIKYLKIDKMKSFIESDIINNKRIKQVFIEAGCGGLFELKFDSKSLYSGKMKLAEQISMYLKTF